MRTVELQQKSGADGMLRLEIPVETVATEFEVVIILQPKTLDAKLLGLENGWPEGFFEETAGAWQGEPFEREE